MPFRERIRYLIGAYRIPYYAIFKVALPFALTFLQLNHLSVALIDLMKNNGAYIDNNKLSLIILFAFFVFLIFTPKLASVLEFIIHPLYFFVSASSKPSSESLFYIAVAFSIILILSKIIFYFVFIVDDKLNPKDDYDYDNANTHWD